MHGEQVLIASSDSVKLRTRKVVESHQTGLNSLMSKTFIIQKEAPSVDMFHSLADETYKEIVEKELQDAPS